MRISLLESTVFVFFSLLVQKASCFTTRVQFQRRCSSVVGDDERHSALSFLLPPSALHCSQVTNAISTDPPGTELLPTCGYCSKSFSSRNALFRHLREDDVCSVQHGGYAGNTASKMVKESVAILFGYEDFAEDDDPSYRPSTLEPTVAEQASQRIREILLEAVRFHLTVDETKQSLSNDEVDIVSSTQSSLARLRHRALSQEPGCSATGDVLVATLTVPSSTNISFWKRVFQSLRQQLSEDESTSGVQLLACRLMDKEIVPFHAERSCTQRIYHYVLPLSWLPDADILTEWWHQPDNGKKQQQQDQRNNLYSNYPQKASKPPTDTLKLLKEALRCAESAHVAVTRNMDYSTIAGANSDSTKVARGRYGALGNKERRPWHSFASPSLKGGAASPNHETVWRVVDRARIIGFVEEENKDLSTKKSDGSNINAIIEIKGDDFLPQQVRRIVGSAVAMTYGWLPKDFFSLATSSSTVVETPLAPAGRMYLSGARFHFNELEADGLQLFESHNSRRIVEEWTGDKAWTTNLHMQQRILQRKTNHAELSVESSWLAELRDQVCPRICKSIDEHMDAIENQELVSADDFDNSYLPVLDELRRIVSDGEWPETSVARSSVIRDKQTAEGNRRSGSFTIVNPSVVAKDSSFPKANEKFPKLVEQVFRLEQALSQTQVDRFTLDGVDEKVLSNRQPSSHCAVNCNAEFTPHVDSGVGKSHC